MEEIGKYLKPIAVFFAISISSFLLTGNSYVKYYIRNGYLGTEAVQLAVKDSLNQAIVFGVVGTGLYYLFKYIIYEGKKPKE